MVVDRPTDDAAADEGVGKAGRAHALPRPLRGATEAALASLAVRRTRRRNDLTARAAGRTRMVAPFFREASATTSPRARATWRNRWYEVRILTAARQQEARGRGASLTLGGRPTSGALRGHPRPANPSQSPGSTRTRWVATHHTITLTTTAAAAAALAGGVRAAVLRGGTSASSLLEAVDGARRLVSDGRGERRRCAAVARGPAWGRCRSLLPRRRRLLSPPPPRRRRGRRRRRS